MTILDRSKIRPEVLKSIDETQKLQLKGALEYLKFEENKGFNLQGYLQKIAEANEKFFQMLSNKEGTIEDLYGFFTDEEMRMLAKFFRFAVDYYIKTELEKYPISEDVKIKEIDAGGVPAEWQIVPGAVDDKVILYLHGGGMVLMSPKTHRALTIEIAQLTKMRVLSVDYRLAPEHPFPAQLEDCVNVYRWLLTQGFKAENIVIAGDSAGGNLTLTSMIKLQDDGIPLPAGAVALSPATDYTDNSETFYKNAKTDPILADIGVFWWLTAFLAGEDPENPLISPLNADLKGLPPILLQVSTSEMLYDHSTRFAEKAKAAGVDVTLQEWKDTIHVFQGFGLHDLPEAKEAIIKIAEFIKKLF
ncbi:MAG: alpha/beta hydrolase [Promethearchaeota archaeon Loki_b32]|nr:MAG: alpha/beta hydrolase [Candidatus Lokiarchaeota archaeon Loki_b32]